MRSKVRQRTAPYTTPIPLFRADWTASGACTSGSTAPPGDATRRARGGAPRRIRQALSKVESSKARPNRDLVEYNPAYKVPRPAPERTRDRVLTDDELRRLWAALDQEPLQVAAFFKLTLLLAARKSELLGMVWSEVDVNAGWWTIPAARSKNNLAHRLPLGPARVTSDGGLILDNLRDLVSSPQASSESRTTWSFGQKCASRR
jgi:integrase